MGVRLAAFNLPSIAKLTMTDELHLQELGERKIALFCCIPDSDKSLNYLVGMIYTQLIQTLYRQADRVHKGRLPVPVHCLMDEYANISLPKDTFLSALATMRSRGIFCSIIVQNMAQLKAMYKDDWESLVGLCDEFLYLGGTEKETHKYVSELLGKETISTTSYNQSKGRSGSYSIFTQTVAHHPVDSVVGLKPQHIAQIIMFAVPDQQPLSGSVFPEESMCHNAYRYRAGDSRFFRFQTSRLFIPAEAGDAAAVLIGSQQHIG